VIETVRDALGDARAWVVGGAVRDRLLGRRGADEDIDVVLEGDARPAARRIARAAGGAAFELSDVFGGWRVVGPGQAWQVDVTPLQGASLAADLAARDLTVNAMAEPLAGGEIVDPHGGREDLAARRLRMVSPEAFAADSAAHPAGRAARVRARLRGRPATAAAARAHAEGLGRVSPERVFAELKRIVVSDAALDGLARMDELGLTAVVLPELDALRGVAQNPYHHRDVHGHTLEVLEAAIALERDPAATLGDELAGGPRAARRAARRRADARRRPAVRALLHDAAKPATRVELPDGRIGFPRPRRRRAPRWRARRSRACARASGCARTSRTLDAPPPATSASSSTRRRSTAAPVYRYLRDTARRRRRDAAVGRRPARDAGAQRRRGDRSPRRARPRDAGRWRSRTAAAAPAAPLVRGDDLARALGIAPGPRLGDLLEAIAEARYAGAVATAEEAVSLARGLLEADGES
jgi:hypothetical protein